MKSKLFTNNPVVSKDFSEDLEIVANMTITDEMLHILPTSLSEYIIARDKKSETKALEEFRTKFGLPPKSFEAILSVGGFFLQSMEVGDTIDVIMEDLKTLAIIDVGKLPKIQPLINALLNEYKTKFLDQKLDIGTQNSGIKTIKATTHLIDLRSVVSNRFEVGDDVNKYKPIVKRLVPIVILRYRLSDDEEVVFQVNIRTLKLLQSELQAAEKEIDETIKLVGKEKISLL